MDFKNAIIKLPNLPSYNFKIINEQEGIRIVPKIITVKAYAPVILYGYKNESIYQLVVHTIKANGELGKEITGKCGIIKAANDGDWILILPTSCNPSTRYCVKYDRLAKVKIITFESGSEIICIKEIL